MSVFEKMDYCEEHDAIFLVGSGCRKCSRAKEIESLRAENARLTRQLNFNSDLRDESEQLHWDARHELEKKLEKAEARAKRFKKYLNLIRNDTCCNVHKECPACLATEALRGEGEE